jgi:hypothetical protein
MNKNRLSRVLRACRGSVAAVKISRKWIIIGAFGLFLLGGAAIGVEVYRRASIEGLPDVGDPFDVAEFRARSSVPDEMNAYTHYRRAFRLLSREAYAWGSNPENTVWMNWRELSPKLREMIESNRPALDAWLRGVDLPDSICFQPLEVGLERDEQFVSTAFAMRTIMILAHMQAGRCETDGNPVDAWKWYRALLRSSRHLGSMGTSLERYLGTEIFRYTCFRIERWAADPRVDAATLRTALDDAKAIRSLTVSNSDIMKTEYLAIMKSLDDPESWIKKFSRLDATWYTGDSIYWFMKNEPERSRRVARLLVANHLAQVDLPARSRSRPAIKLPAIYRTDPTRPAATRVLPPPEIARWFQSALLERLWIPQFSLPVIDQSDRAHHAAIVVKFAWELFKRERGREPNSIEELIGKDLREIPEDYKGSSLPRRRQRYNGNAYPRNASSSRAVRGTDLPNDSRTPEKEVEANDGAVAPASG